MDDTTWRLNRFFILRVGGIPVESIEEIRTPEAAAWADDVVTAERHLHADGVAVCAALTAAVGDNPDETNRRALLALRRDVFNLRLPRQLPAAQRIADQLTPTDRAQTIEWLQHRQDYQRLLGEGATVVTRDLQSARRHLQKVATDQRLREGILLASSSLDEYLPRYLDRATGPLSKRERQVERSLLEYVYRSACKTSPFSTLTTVGLGAFQPGGPQHPAPVHADLSAVSHPRLNVAVLGRLADAIVTNPSLRGDLPVEVTSGLSTDHDRVRYIRRTRQTSSDDAAMTFDSLQEDLFFLAQGTILKEVMSILADEPRLTFRQLADRMCAVDRHQRSRTDVETFLYRLLRLGLLTVPSLYVDIHHPDPLGDFRTRITGLHTAWATQLGERLTMVADRIAEFAGADLGGRRNVLSAVRDTLNRTHHDIAASNTGSTAAIRTLVYEDAAVRGDGFDTPLGRWRTDLLPSLSKLADLLPLFEVLLPHRLVLKGYFLARYGRGGRCDDLLRFIQAFHVDFYDQYVKATFRRRAFDSDGTFIAQPNWLRMPEIDALDAARQDVARLLRERFAAHPDDGSDLHLDDEFVAAVKKRMPSLPESAMSYSVFLQLGTDEGRPLAVVNRCYGGLTFLFSRFAHCFVNDATRDLLTHLRGALSEAQPPGAVFAELKGGYETTNLNLHPPVTSHHLVCPGEQTSVPEESRISVEELTIEHDAEQDRLFLWSARLQREVVPVYLGFLMPMALPDVQRTLLLFSPISMAQIDLWNGVDRPLGDNRIGGHPRTRLGNLVLTRRTWKTDPQHLPARPASAADPAWFLAWQRWRREHGIPRHVFAAVDTTTTNDDGQEPAMRSGKPQFVDFDSYLSLTLLEHLIRSADRRVVLTETLPALDQLWLQGSDGRYVTEHSIEITRPVPPQAETGFTLATARPDGGTP